MPSVGFINFHSSYYYYHTTLPPNSSCLHVCRLEASHVERQRSNFKLSVLLLHPHHSVPPNPLLLFQIYYTCLQRSTRSKFSQVSTLTVHAFSLRSVHITLSPHPGFKFTTHTHTHTLIPWTHTHTHTHSLDTHTYTHTLRQKALQSNPDKNQL